MKKVKDHYYKLAKEKNYSARSAFKLEEIDKKYKLIKKKMSVLDLGASPGSWTEYVLRKTESTASIIAIDLKPLETKLADKVQFFLHDITQLSEKEIPSDKKFDIVLSDMAPNTSGNKGLDHQRSLELCYEVVKQTKLHLKTGGSMICKVFQGEDLQSFVLDEVKPIFKSYKQFKPKSTRSESVEIFIIGFDYLGEKEGSEL